jgi:hypothetical protein
VAEGGGAARLRNLGLTVPVTEVLDPELWRSRYAFGITLGQDALELPSSRNRGPLGNALCSFGGDELADAVEDGIGQIPEEVIRWHLKTALSELELKLGIPLGVVICKADPVDEGLRPGVDFDKVVSRRPYTHGEGMTWYKLDLPSSVISVERVRAYYYGQLIWEFDQDRGNMEQIRVEWSRQGAVHLLPINFQSVIVTQGPGTSSGNYGVWHTLALHQSPVPDFWAVDYTLGPVTTQTGECGRIEAALAHWVYCVAGMTLLSMGGLAKSQGLTSTSVSFDGFSRSVGLQASAIYGLNSALEHVLEQATKRLDWKQIKRSKKGLRIRPYSF